MPSTTTAPGLVHAGAIGLDAVDGVEIPVGVEHPEDRAVLRRVGAHAAIVRAAEYGPGNRGDRGALARSATGFLLAAEQCLRWHLPGDVSVGKRNGGHAAGFGGKETIGAGVEIDAIGRAAPLATRPLGLPKVCCQTMAPCLSGSSA